MIDSLVSPKWLVDNITDKNLIILDATQEEKEHNFKNVQIEHTRFFDIKNKFSNTKTEFPNTLPNAKEFEIACQQLGITKTSKIVVYDKLGIFSSPRVWWLFKIMGHDNVAVLNGGFPEWIKNGYKTEKPTINQYKLGDFKAKLNTNAVSYFEQIKQNINSQNALVIDVRSAARFMSLVPEKRANLRSGTIPNAINIPYQNVLDNGKFKSKKELKKELADLKTDKPLIFSCGSGITACIVYLACDLVLDNKKSVYDGSWTEFGTLVDGD